MSLRLREEDALYVDLGSSLVTRELTPLAARKALDPLADRRQFVFPSFVRRLLQSASPNNSRKHPVAKCNGRVESFELPTVQMMGERLSMKLRNGDNSAWSSFPTRNTRIKEHDRTEIGQLTISLNH